MLNNVFNKSPNPFLFTTQVSSTVSQILGGPDSEDYQTRFFLHVFETYHTIFTKHAKEKWVELTFTMIQPQIL